MSWLGGRLSQFSSLTDQISSFTKEVLTETTEEVEGTISQRITNQSIETTPISAPSLGFSQCVILDIGYVLAVVLHIREMGVLRNA